MAPLLHRAAITIQQCDWTALPYNALERGGAEDLYILLQLVGWATGRTREA